MKYKWIIIVLVATALAGCSNDAMDHSTMKHSTSGDVPKTTMKAEQPTYKVGSKAVITDAHMEGMNGREAKIVGAYNTTAYIVSYKPTNDEVEVNGHKWVIHEELQTKENAPLAAGTKVVLNAEHMEGMKGAEATIDEAVQTTVYMIDYTTPDGERVKNHQWVIESELTAK